MSTQHEHHPLRRLAEALDKFDNQVSALRHDVAGGIHDAIMDEASLLHVRDDPSLTIGPDETET